MALAFQLWVVGACVRVRHGLLGRAALGWPGTCAVWHLEVRGRAAAQLNLLAFISVAFLLLCWVAVTHMLVGYVAAAVGHAALRCSRVQPSRGVCCMVPAT